MTLSTGTHLDRYEIISPLGRGGMGEVYLAQDTRLKRKVALKLLPAQFTRDEDRVRRFEQEAQAASALNHPNIITIHEIGQVDSSHFIATEFIAGQTLRQIPTQEKLGLRSALDVAIQVASALAAAHAAGIVHRDIKPENVMVRPDGLVKVLDFGLAKLTEKQSPTTDNEVPTSAGTETDPGTVMGTAQYMSPEQARGQTVDDRTDIFSLGVVLYEMITGKGPFEGATASDVIASILTKEPPPVSRYSPEVPAELERIITKALQKDREERYQVVKELLLDVKQLKQRLEFEAELARSARQGEKDATAVANSGQPATETAHLRPAHTAEEEIARTTSSAEYLVGAINRHKQGAVLALAILLAAGAGIIFWLSSWTGQHRAPPLDATARIIPFTTFGAADHPAFSPDGNQIAFTWDGGSGDNLDIYVKLIGAGAPLRLTTDPAEDLSPAWSPDGRYIAFLRRSAIENGIFFVPALGGPERKLGKTEPSRSRLAWSVDGKFLAIVDRSSPQEGYGIFLLSVEDGEKQRLTSPPKSSDDNYPAFSPDGKTLAFIRSGGLTFDDIYLIPIHGGQLRRLTADDRRIYSMAWTANGREIVFSSNRGGSVSLWRVAASGGTPEWVAATGQNAYSPAISRQGNRLAYNVSFLDTNIWRMERSSATDQAAAGRKNSPTKFISSTRKDDSPQFSPNGKKIVFDSDRSGSEEIWVCDSDGSHPVQLTFFDGPAAGTPRWSPDGQQIVFDAHPAGNADIYVISAEGGKPRRLTLGPFHNVMPSWSRDGRWIYYCSNRSGAFQTWKVPAAGGQAMQVTKQGGFEAFESPDGKLLYYTKGRGAGGIWRMPVEGGEEMQVPELLNAGYCRYWAVLDDGIYFVSQEASSRPAIKFFSFATHRVTPIGVLEREPLQGPPGLTVSPDGRWVLYVQVDQSISDIMLVENFR